MSFNIFPQEQILVQDVRPPNIFPQQHEVDPSGQPAHLSALWDPLPPDGRITGTKLLQEFLF